MRRIPRLSVCLGFPILRKECCDLKYCSIMGAIYPFQCSCLENPRDGGAWWAAVYGVAELDMTEAT